MISVLQGCHNPQRYDVNANNEITARGHVYSGLSHRKRPARNVEYNSAKLTLRSWKEHPTSKATITQYFLEGGKFALKGTDDLKTDPV